ncbi:MAG: extracellular solute-binding protein [Pseudomonadota bacterium]
MNAATRRITPIRTIWRSLAVAAALVASPAAAPAGENVLRLMNWADFTSPEMIDAFERETGITVLLDNYLDVDVALERLIAETADIDLAVISDERVGQLRDTGVLAAFDPALIPNRAGLDPAIAAKLPTDAKARPLAVPYLWGTTGIGYTDQALARSPEGLPDSWSLIFDPQTLARYADCGVFVTDTRQEVFSSAAVWLGLDPNAPQSLEAARQALTAAAPHWQRIDEKIIEALADGQYCLALVWNADALLAADRAGNATNVHYLVPREGAPVWVDAFVLPRTSANPEAAHRFIDFFLRPGNAAMTTNAFWTASAVLEAADYLDAEVAEHPGVYPPLAAREHLFRLAPRTPEQHVAEVKAWRRIQLSVGSALADIPSR